MLYRIGAQQPASFYVELLEKFIKAAFGSTETHWAVNVRSFFRL
jgi:hypothetical protein